MAVDTAEKRFSMLNFWDGTTLHLLFETDGTVDDDDRAHMLDLYSGIPLGAVQIIAQARTTFRRIFSRVFSRVN